MSKNHTVKPVRPLAPQYVTGVYISCAALILGTVVFKLQWLPLAFAVCAALGGYHRFNNRKILCDRTTFSTDTDVLLETKKVLDPVNSQGFPLIKKTALSHNTAIYRFGLPTPNSILGLPIGQHISMAANLDVRDPKTEKVENKEVFRSYTPISSDFDLGYFDLLIKSYPNGNISRHLATLKIGDTMKVKGPKGAMVYTPNMVRRFGMIAGGTGITPMLQIIKAIVRGRKSGDKTEVDLIFANVNAEDILLKEDMDKLAREDDKFRVYYVLNNPPETWDGGVGFVTPDMVKVRIFNHWKAALRMTIFSLETFPSTCF